MSFLSFAWIYRLSFTLLVLRHINTSLGFWICIHICLCMCYFDCIPLSSTSFGNITFINVSFTALILATMEINVFWNWKKGTSIMSIFRLKEGFLKSGLKETLKNVDWWRHFKIWIEGNIWYLDWGRDLKKIWIQGYIKICIEGRI